MKTVGIIAEFNPFHNVHKYLIEQSKKLTGAECCAVIMSGDFVQRGAPAICNKYLRTEMALNGGADIVFELPTVYSLGSAEAFADGAVRLLCSTGQIDYLCFGSECGDTKALAECAAIIEDRASSPAFKEKLSCCIKSGMSYPQAYSNALSDVPGDLQALLRTPNNLLGIEYLRAIMRLKKQESSGIPDQDSEPRVDEQNIAAFRQPVPLAINRNESNHFDTEITGFSSSSALRRSLICENDPEKLSVSLPAKAYDVILENCSSHLPIVEDDFNNMLYMRLNSMTNDELLAIPDINPDLIHGLIRFKGKHIIISNLIMELKSKRFTYTAISRALFRILLCPAYSDVAKNMITAKNACCKTAKTACFISGKPYLRLLGFRKSSSGFLRTLRYSDQIDVITKPANGPLLDPSYKLDLYASNIYEQVCSEKFRTDFIEELKSGPVMVYESQAALG